MRIRLNFLVFGFITLTFSFTACGSNQQTVIPTISPTASSTILATPSPTAESTTLPVATVLPSITASPSLTPNLTSNPIPAPTKVPTTKPTKQPSPTPISMPFKHIAINPDIMSSIDRDKLNADQKEMLAYLDDYVYYYNRHSDAQVDGHDFSAIDALSSFGVGEIMMKAIDSPIYKQTKSDGEMHVLVEIKHAPKDATPYFSKNCTFLFSNRIGWWILQYMFD